MSTLALSVYILMWPALVAVVLYVISHAFVREWVAARREGRPMI